MDIRKKLMFREPNGILGRLYDLENLLEQVDDMPDDNLPSDKKELKERIKKEIDVLRYDLKIGEQIIQEKEVKANELKNEIETEEKQVIGLINRYVEKSRNSKVTLKDFATNITIFMVSALLLTLIYFVFIAPDFWEGYRRAIQVIGILIAICVIVIEIRNSKWYRENKKRVQRIREQKKELEYDLAEINSLKQRMYFAGKNEPVRNGVDHYQNREWLIESVKRLESEGCSQNRALEEARRLYKKEFSLKPPGKTTILRYLGRTE